MNKSELIKVVHKEAAKVGVDPKILASAKGDQEFRKIHDAEIKVLNREHSKKIRKARKLRKKIYDQYRWKTSSRLKPKTITDIHIHPNINPVVITIFRGNHRRNFDVHNPFMFGYFKVIKLDELGPIIQKNNKVVGELMRSLGNICDRLRVVPKELRISSSLLALDKFFSSPQEGKGNIRNWNLKPPKNGLFSIDVFDDEAFQRMSDIHTVDQTQSTRFKLLILSSLGDSDDELKEDSDDDMFKAGDKMDKYIQEPKIKENQTHHSTETPTEEHVSQEHQDQTNKLVMKTINHLDKISQAGVNERAKLFKTLNRVFKTLKADSDLKEAMQKIGQSNNTTFGNIINLTELLRNAQLLEILTQ
nr:hypothetical protein [Tanacetum cinerariifolium]